MPVAAPVPARLEFAAHRVRCACAVESAIIAPRAWYVGQRAVAVEEACPACGKPLGAVEIPEGALHELWEVAKLPASRALAVSAELLDEVAAARSQAVPEPADGMGPARWCLPHDAPQAYEAWLAKQPPPAPPVPWLTPVDLAATGLLVVVVLVCALV